MARPGLPNHPKFRALVSMLGISEAHALGHLEFLWLAAYETGDPLIGGPVQVEAVSRWAGEKGAMFDALLNCGGQGRAGFIETSEGSANAYQIHDLYDHAPEYIQKRMKRELERKHKGQERQKAFAPRLRKHTAAWREDLGSLSQPLSDLGQTPSAQHPAPNMGEESPIPPLARSPADADSGRHGENDSRKVSPHAQSNPPASAAAQDAAPPLTPDAGSDPVVLTFPCVGRGPKEWHLRQSKLREWCEAFPGVDVAAECRRALQWARDNPSKRKTHGGMSRFLGSWLGRAQDRCGYRPSVNGAAKPQETIAEKIKRLKPKESQRDG